VAWKTFLQLAGYDIALVWGVGIFITILEAYS